MCPESPSSAILISAALRVRGEVKVSLPQGLTEGLKHSCQHAGSFREERDSNGLQWVHTRISILHSWWERGAGGVEGKLVGAMVACEGPKSSRVLPRCRQEHGGGCGLWQEPGFSSLPPSPRPDLSVLPRPSLEVTPSPGSCHCNS